MKVIFTPLAIDQLDSLHDYITRQSYESRADEYVIRIIERCETIGISPYQGTAREDLDAGLRTIGFERRVTILFSVMENEVLIEAIYYGGQDFEAGF